MSYSLMHRPRAWAVFPHLLVKSYTSPTSISAFSRTLEWQVAESTASEGSRMIMLHSRLPPISIDAGFSVNCPLLNPLVGVAQLVERRSVAPNVAGSIPVAHPRYIHRLPFTRGSIFSRRY